MCVCSLLLFPLPYPLYKLLTPANFTANSVYSFHGPIIHNYVYDPSGHRMAQHIIYNVTRGYNLLIECLYCRMRFTFNEFTSFVYLVFFIKHYHGVLTEPIMPIVSRYLCVFYLLPTLQHVTGSLPPSPKSSIVQSRIDFLYWGSVNCCLPDISIGAVCKCNQVSCWA